MRNIQELDLTLLVRAMPGAVIETTACELVILAERLGLAVECRFNEVKLIALPGGSVDELVADFRDCIANPKRHQIAIAPRPS